MKNNLFNDRICSQVRGFLQEKTGHLLHIGTIRQAFIRRSYAAQNGGEDCEKLEFIGDRVLDLYVTKIITDRFGGFNQQSMYHLWVSPGELTEMKKQVVSNQSLAKIIDQWDVAKYILAAGKEAEDIESNEKAKADLYEALLGAITIERKWDPEVLEEVVRKTANVEEVIQQKVEELKQLSPVSLDGAVSMLKELHEKGRCSMPEHEFIELQHDADGNPIWACKCTVTSFKCPRITVFANSKSECKKAADYIMLVKEYEEQNAYGHNGTWIIWYVGKGPSIEPFDNDGRYNGPSPERYFKNK